ncbi:hypothetical protein QUA56_17475 [Microcoleus sp. N3A4]|uniref:hypothetical protein n=1 Tax=Microcoleus sp. N3A4 TaxID=3055379 RepID=UPI002FD65A0F
MIPRTRQCRVPTRLIVGTRHCRVLSVGNINNSDATGFDMKGEKLGFYEIVRRGTRNLARNRVSTRRRAIAQIIELD